MSKPLGCHSKTNVTHYGYNNLFQQTESEINKYKDWQNAVEWKGMMWQNRSLLHMTWQNRSLLHTILIIKTNSNAHTVHVAVAEATAEAEEAKAVAVAAI